jgi:hypothetical protein
MMLDEELVYKNPTVPRDDRRIPQRGDAQRDEQSPPRRLPHVRPTPSQQVINCHDAGGKNDAD